jgi:hypothetical protein
MRTNEGKTMKKLSLGIAAVAMLIWFGSVYMAGEREEAQRLWGVNLEAAVRAGDLDRAESLFAEEAHTPKRTSPDQMSADIAASNYAFGMIVSLGRSYEVGERDGIGYCDLKQRMNREMRKDIRYRFPESLRQFVIERCDEIREEKRLEVIAVIAAKTTEREQQEADNAAAAAARNQNEAAAWEQKEADRMAASLARKAARTAEDAEVMARREKTTEIENTRLQEIGVDGFFSSRLADTILSLEAREITRADVGGRVFGCGRIVNALEESCHYRDGKIEAIEVIEEQGTLYALDEWRGSTHHEFTILVRDSIEPGETLVGMPLPYGYYKLDGTQTYETATGSTKAAIAIVRIE